MKDIEPNILLVIESLILLVVCSATKSKKTIESFITNLISNDTYKNIELGSDRT